MNKFAFKDLLSLIKFPVSIVISITTFFGAFLFKPQLNVQIILISISTFILAAGVLALNNIQDRSFDSKMNRTQNRPLPKNRIKVSCALFVSVSLILLSLVLIYFLFPLEILTWSLFVIILYNGLYTPLKPRSSAAFIPGVICGVLPILIGWRSVAGPFDNTLFLLLVTLFVLWQVPHFSLVSLQNSGNSFLLKILIMAWLLAFSSVVIMIPYFNIILSPLLKKIIVLPSLVLIASFLYFLFFNNNKKYKLCFTLLNLSMFVILLITAIDRFHSVNFATVTASCSDSNGLLSKSKNL